MLTLAVILFAIGALLLVGGGIWCLVVGFKEHLLWGLGMLLFSPASLVFVVMKWSVAKHPFLTQVGGLALWALAFFALPGSMRSQALGMAQLAAVNSSGESATVSSSTGSLEAAPQSAASPLVELSAREGALRARKASLDPMDRKGAEELSAEIMEYNRQLAAALGQQKPSAPEAAPPSPFLQTLKPELVSIEGGRLQPLGDRTFGNAKFIAVYFSASWCPPCRAFTPELVKFYQQQKQAGAAMEVILVSSDKDRAAMERYMKEHAMPWPAVQFEKRRSSALSKFAGKGIPCLTLLDENGKVLARSYEGSRYVGPRKVLNELAQRLSKEPPSQVASVSTGR